MYVWSLDSKMALDGDPIFLETNCRKAPKSLLCSFVTQNACSVNIGHSPTKSTDTSICQKHKWSLQCSARNDTSAYNVRTPTQNS